MKILYWQWHSFMGKGVERAFEKLEMEYDTFFYQMTDWEKDEEFQTKWDEKMKNTDYRFVFSIDYNPLISEVCQNRGIIYISWIYDSPIHIRDLSSLGNSCNRAYFFDRGQVEAYKRMGYEVNYLPLAADVETFLPMTVNQTDREKYRADIAMVGKLYETSYQEVIALLDPYQQGYLEGIVASQKQVYGGYFLYELMTEHMLEEINRTLCQKTNGQFQVNARELEFLLASELTRRERYSALALLSNHFDVALYSTDIGEKLPRVRKNGYVDYYGIMPLVFKSSKINLNISLKTIQTGIPLRVLDILASGGFVLTNYQAELSEYFSIGEELVTYSSLEEMYELADYYLKNEELRRRIAENGLQRVKKDFTFESRIREMFQE